MSNAGIVASCACMPSQSALPPGRNTRSESGRDACRADGVDAHVRADAPGQLEHAGVQVVGRHHCVREQPHARVALEHRLADDDAPCARRAQELCCQRSDRPGSEHDRRLDELVRNQRERMDAGGEGLGEDDDVCRAVGRQRVDAPQRHRHELGEAARTRASDEIAMTADVLAARATPEAVAAGHLRVDDDTAADEPVAGRPAGLDDLSGQLVAHDQRRAAARAARRDPVDIGRADPGGIDADQYLVGLRRRRRDVLDLEVERLGVHQRTHGVQHNERSIVLLYRSLGIVRQREQPRRAVERVIVVRAVSRERQAVARLEPCRLVVRPDLDRS